MKKILGILAVLALLCFAGAAVADVEINAANFPDPVFMDFVMQFDSDGSGAFSYEELVEVKQLSMDGMGLSDLTGIEHFGALFELSCNSNQLTTLDLSRNPGLTDLYCNDNQLTKLNVSENRCLLILECVNNKLTKLDMSNSPSLVALGCYGNLLTKLNISKNTKLIEARCSNNRLTSLTLPASSDLCILDATSNSIKKLDVSKTPLLEKAVNTVSPTPYLYWDGGFSINWVVDNQDGYIFFAVDKNVEVTSGGETIAEPTEVTEFRNNGLIYSLNNEKNTATVAGVTDKKAKELVIEDQVYVLDKVFKVTGVRDGALKGLKKLTSLVIGKNVKAIGKNAFYKCAKLKTITIQTTKLTSKTVGANAFKGVYKKVTVKVPAKKLKAYKTLLVKKGLPKTAKVKK